MYKVGRGAQVQRMLIDSALGEWAEKKNNEGGEIIH